MNSLRSVWKSCAAFAVACLAASVSQAQQQPPSPTPSKETRRAKGERDIDRFRRLDPYFRSWLIEDVVYIIAPTERSAFVRTNSDDERRKFIQQFWDRRNPDPDNLENSYEQEHYRRFIYANEHFGGSVDGWKSDRGRIYIELGPPDSIESAVAGRDCAEHDSRNEVVHNAPASFIWKYQYLEGIGENVELSFVQNDARRGDSDDSEFVLSSSVCRYSPISPLAPGIIRFFIPAEQVDYASPDVISRYLDSSAAAPHPKNTDLPALLDSHAKRSQFPLRVESSLVRATKITSVASVTVAIPTVVGVAGKNERGTSATIYGRFIHKASGVAEGQFELSVFAIRDEGRTRDWIELCDKAFPLPAGTYELQIAVKDTVTGDVATHYSEVSVEPSALLTKSAAQ
jgi:GWxTD domain-containing protein